MNGSGSSEQQKQRLRDQARTLRSLPPGTRLNVPTNTAVRTLLDMLLASPPERDAVEWMYSERLADAARITFEWAVRSLWTIVRDAAIAGASRMPLVGLDQALPRILRSVAEARDSELSHLLREADAGERDPDHVFATLRRLARGTGEVAVIIDDKHHQFLIDLLLSSRDSDPLEWIATNRPDFATCSVIAGIIEQSVPAEPQYEDVVETRELAAGVETDVFGVVLERFVRRPTGFSLAAKISLAGGLPAPPAGYEGRTVRWRGFNLVSDDIGNSYFARSVKAGPAINERVQDVSMGFFPAPAAAADRLVFESKPVVLDFKTVGFDRPPRFSELEVQASLTWSLPLTGG